MGFWFSRITRISLIISSFFGCWDKFIVLMATSLPVATSIAIYTVPDALQKNKNKISEIQKYWGKSTKGFEGIEEGSYVHPKVLNSKMQKYCFIKSECCHWNQTPQKIFVWNLILILSFWFLYDVSKALKKRNINLLNKPLK